MLNSKKLEEIAQQISDAVPPSMKTVAEGAEAKVKQVLQSQISRLDFVSREEFDIQTQVLKRTRLKLEALEKKLLDLNTKPNK